MNTRIHSLRVLRVRIESPGAILWWFHHGKYWEASVAACQVDQGSDGFLAEREVTESSGWGRARRRSRRIRRDIRAAAHRRLRLSGRFVKRYSWGTRPCSCGSKFRGKIWKESALGQPPPSLALPRWPCTDSSSGFLCIAGLYSSLFSFLDQAICSVSKFPSYLAIGGTHYFPIRTPAARLNPQLHVQIYCFGSDRIAKVIV